jgi:hypothetical protein
MIFEALAIAALWWVYQDFLDWLARILGEPS